MSSETPASSRKLRLAVPLAVVAGLLLRAAWPLADVPPRTSWSNGIFTDPQVMVRAARDAHVFGTWVVDTNRDLWVFPLINVLTWLTYFLAGPSRLATVLLAAALGAATIAALAWGLRRSLGPWAAAIGAILFAFGAFPLAYGRIPVAENVAALLLALSAGCAMGRTRRALAAAGALGVAATLLGKYHAVGFLPGLVLFVWLRDRAFRSLAALIAGGAAVFALWLVILFLPHRAEILFHVRQQSTGLHGTPPLAKSLAEGLGELLNTVRRSWLFYRIPVAGAVGGLFALWTVANARARRARLQDGSAIYAFWFVSIWIYYALLPYKAPRYFVLVAPALCAAAAAAFALAGRAGSFRLRAPARWDEHVPLAAWLYAFVFTFVDAVKHYASMMIEYLSLPPARITAGQYEALVDFFARFDTFQQGLFWAGIFGIALYLLVLWHPEALRVVRRDPVLSGAAIRRGVLALVALEVAGGLAHWTWFATHRTTWLEDVKSSFPAMVGPDAVLLGSLAPALTQDSTYRSHPYFRGLTETYGITHVWLCGESDHEAFEDRYPGLVDSTRIVQVFPVRTLFAGTLELRLLPRSWKGVALHDHSPTIYERASDAAATGRWQEALDLFAEHRRAGLAVPPELISLEAVCWFKLERYSESEKLLALAIDRRPRDPLNWRNLGILHLRRGERAAALEALMKSYRLDPMNEDLRKMLEELRR